MSTARGRRLARVDARAKLGKREAAAAARVCCVYVRSGVCIIGSRSVAAEERRARLDALAVDAGGGRSRRWWAHVWSRGVAAARAYWGR